MISWRAAPVKAVTTPIFLGNFGNSFLCSSSKYPSSENFSFTFSNFA